MYSSNYLQLKSPRVGTSRPTASAHKGVLGRALVRTGLYIALGATAATSIHALTLHQEIPDRYRFKCNWENLL